MGAEIIANGERARERGMKRWLGFALSKLRRLSARQGALLLIGATLAVLWVWGSYSYFVPCAQDCGETFIAQQSVANYHVYGLKYLLLEDRATIPDPDRHPFIYTHNIHLGSLVFPLLDRLGISSLWGKQILVLLAFGAGLFYLFLTIRYVTKSDLAGLCVLALFCTDYAYVFAFGLNALRAWHWLAIFGLLYHALRIVSATGAPRAVHLLGVPAFSAIAFGIGYEFLAIVMAITFFVACLCSRSFPRTLLCVGWLIGSVAALFAFRQVQVISVMGYEFWARDMFYSSVIKLTALATYFNIPTLAGIDDFYLKYGVLRPFAAVTPLDQVILGIEQHLDRITFPSAGVVATVTCLVAIFLSVVVTIAWILRSLIGGTERRLSQAMATWIDTTFTARFYLALVLGVAVGLVAFGSITISVYLKHQMPLMAAVLLIPLGILLALLLRLAVTPSSRSGIRLAAAAIAALLIGDHIAMQFQNGLAVRPMPVAWIPEVVKREDATFAVSWIPSSVRGFSRNWVIGIQPGRERVAIDRANRGEPPFAEEDLLEVNAGHKDEMEKYHLLRPDYWLYYAIDQKTEYQATVPTCNRSYARRLFDDLFLPQRRPKLERIAVAEQGATRVAFGELNVTGRAIRAVEIRNGHNLLARMGLNCDESTFAGELTLTLPTSDAVKARIDAVAYNGRRYRLEDSEVIPLEAATALPTSLTRHQPSAEALTKINRALPVAAKGRGWVLFDLRPFWKR